MLGDRELREGAVRTWKGGKPIDEIDRVGADADDVTMESRYIVES